MRDRPCRWFALWIAATLVHLVGCSREAEKPTQLVVYLDAAPTVAAQLRSLLVEVYARDEHEPASSQRLVLNSGNVSTAGFKLPLSFGIHRQRASELTLVITGYGDDRQHVLIEKKVLAAFVKGATRLLPIYLSEVCLNRVCADPTLTCYERTDGDVAAGECGAVRVASTTPTQPGRELDFTWPREEPKPVIPDADVASDAGVDSSVPLEASPDASGMPPEPESRSGYLMLGGSVAGGPSTLFAVRVNDGIPEPMVELRHFEGQERLWVIGGGKNQLAYYMTTNEEYGRPNSLSIVDLSAGLPATFRQVVATQEGRSVSHWATSKDGRYLSYALRRGDNTSCEDLFVVDLQAKGELVSRQVNEPDAGTRAPSSWDTQWVDATLLWRETENCVDYTQDWTQILFMEDMNAAAPTPRQLTHVGMDTGSFLGGSLHPDGEEMLYASDNGDAGLSLFALKGLPGAPSEPETIAWPDAGTYDWLSPQFSPDGTKVVLTVRERENKFFLYLLERDSDPPRLTRLNADVLTEHGSLHAEWSPDSKKVGYTESGSNVQELFVVDLSFERPNPARWITKGLVPGGFGVQALKWTADSMVVLFQGEPHEPHTYVQLASNIGPEGPSPWFEVAPNLPAGARASSGHLTPYGKYFVLSVRTRNPDETVAGDVYLVPVAEIGTGVYRRLGDSPAPQRSSGMYTVWADDAFGLRSEQETPGAGLTLYFETLDGTRSPAAIATFSSESYRGALWVPDAPATQTTP